MTFKEFINSYKFALMTNPFVLAGSIVSICVLVMVAVVFATNYHTSDIQNNSVMITNRALNHGGTGIIYQSTDSETSILTNAHVCGVVKEGGVVQATSGNYQVSSIVESKLSDLCLVYVADNLHTTTYLSPTGPRLYEEATVSGHPALMPTVLSKGHFSGKSIIQVMTGFRPCTDDEQDDLITGPVCIFFNGFPVIKAYESTLVTATIMPGSSGSGVYNSKNQLSGVVFAGQGELSYGWIVPFEQVVYFLNTESETLDRVKINQEVSIFGKSENNRLREVLKKCKNATKEVIVNYCSILSHDMTWVK